MTIDPNDINARDLYRFLSTAVAPRPIAFASTVDRVGRVNLSPFSYFNVFSTTPPILVFSPLNRGRDGSSKDTLDNLREVPEVTINIVSYGLVEQMSLASANYAKGVNEFVKSGLTEKASEAVRPPRVAECPVSFECTVDRIVELGEGAGAGHLVLARVVRMHAIEAVCNEDRRLNTSNLDLVARLGGDDYCRVTPESIFCIPKPTATVGMGVDSLPYYIRNSDELSGNELGRLATLERLPEEDFVRGINEREEVREARSAGEVQLHALVHRYLREERIEEALSVLMG